MPYPCAFYELSQTSFSLFFFSFPISLYEVIIYCNVYNDYNKNWNYKEIRFWITIIFQRMCSLECFLMEKDTDFCWSCKILSIVISGPFFEPLTKKLWLSWSQQFLLRNFNFYCISFHLQSEVRQGNALHIFKSLLFLSYKIFYKQQQKIGERGRNGNPHRAKLLFR